MTTFYGLKSLADTIGRGCQIAHDLQRQGDKDFVAVMDSVADDAARLAKESLELASKLCHRHHPEIPDLATDESLCDLAEPS